MAVVVKVDPLRPRRPWSREVSPPPRPLAWAPPRKPISRAAWRRAISWVWFLGTWAALLTTGAVFGWGEGASAHPSHLAAFVALMAWCVIGSRWIP